MDKRHLFEKDDRPVIIEICDSEEKVKAFLPALDEIMESGLVTIEKDARTGISICGFRIGLSASNALGRVFSGAEPLAAKSRKPWCRLSVNSSLSGMST
jgi:hypothetical protein